jgi:hypothetical protein
MKNKLSFLLILMSITTYSQVKANSDNFWTAKEFSKDISLYRSKEFLFKKVLGSSEKVVSFEIIPLAASNSGELTTLIYKCEEKNKEGLILCFYGDYWNDNGVLYQGYAFKNLEKNNAIEFLSKIEKSINDNLDYLKTDFDNNNIFFVYDDIEVLIWVNAGIYTIRVFWNGFDSTWEKTAFERSKRRFEKKI